MKPKYEAISEDGSIILDSEDNTIRVRRCDGTRDTYFKIENVREVTITPAGWFRFGWLNFSLEIAGKHLSGPLICFASGDSVAFILMANLINERASKAVLA